MHGPSCPSQSPGAGDSVVVLNSRRTLRSSGASAAARHVVRKRKSTRRRGGWAAGRPPPCREEEEEHEEEVRLVGHGAVVATGMGKVEARLWGNDMERTRVDVKD
ncbi:hypothetical protein B296_00017531 [Ensete ventricosum]|uniref:Uncharacterized protein n=1 Tax=Ensete ventricosum TaxID=4639 RepID=A0A426YGL4_ENSVE|nr:hypothetical protein B296_00017531 [Ensete ventricosum]